MLKPFANSARAVATGPLTWKTWTGLIVVPVIVLGLLMWAFWSPTTNHGTAMAAVVNDDEPVTIQGQIVPLGRQLAQYLTHNEDSPYTWVLTDPADAREGLADGDYVASVTIPSDFSARATSVGTAEPLQARRAELRIQTSAAAGVMDPVAGEQIAEATQRVLNTQVVETYLDNIYVAFSTIHDKLGEAADGAAKLADGTRKLAAGAGQLADGADKLDAGADKLADGAGALAAGMTKLASGSSRLADGLTQAERDTARLPELTRQLADGARQVANGNQRLADTVVPLADRVVAAIDQLPSAEDSAAQFQNLADQCPSAGGVLAFCDQLADTADRFSAEASTIDSTRVTIRAQVVQTRDAVQALAVGADKVADGTARLADGMTELTAGIAAAAEGARALNAGIGKAETGAHQLSDGADRLSAGAGKLADGAGKLHDGAVKVDKGAHRLAAGLDEARDKVPSYTKAERDHLKTIAATPTTALASESDLGRSAVALWVAIALWTCALVTYILTRAVPTAVLVSREPSWRIIARSGLPGTAAAYLAAAAISAIVIPALGLGVGRSVAFIAVTLLAALTFVAVNQAAVALFGAPGRFVSLAVLVLTPATGVVSTLPPFFHAIADYLPSHGAVLALRAIITGTDGALTGIIELAVWLVIGSAAAIAVTERRRTLSTKQVRLGAFRPTEA